MRLSFALGSDRYLGQLRCTHMPRPQNVHGRQNDSDDEHAANDNASGRAATTTCNIVACFVKRNLFDLCASTRLSESCARRQPGGGLFGRARVYSQLQFALIDWGINLTICILPC